MDKFVQVQKYWISTLLNGMGTIVNWTLLERSKIYAFICVNFLKIFTDRRRPHDNPNKNRSRTPKPQLDYVCEILKKVNINSGIVFEITVDKLNKF